MNKITPSELLKTQAVADRIKDWDEFKVTIEKYEKGELKSNLGKPSEEMQKDFQDFINQLKNNNKEQKKGCLGLLMILVFGILLFI